MERTSLVEFVAVLKMSLDGERYAGRLVVDAWELLQALSNISMADVNKQEMLNTDLLAFIQRVFIERPDDERYFDFWHS